MSRKVQELELCVDSGCVETKSANNFYKRIACSQPYYSKTSKNLKYVSNKQRMHHASRPNSLIHAKTRSLHSQNLGLDTQEIITHPKSMKLKARGERRATLRFQIATMTFQFKLPQRFTAQTIFIL